MKLLAVLSLVAVAVGAAPLQIKTSSLPGGVFGAPYSAQLTATGGISPYTWVVSAGQLPAGLTLSPSGAISGTPSGVSSMFSVRVTDSSAQTRTFSISITPAPVPPPTTGQVIWSAGVEAGSLAEWWLPSTYQGGNNGGGEYNSGIADTVASQDYAHTGSWSAKMTVTTPSSPSSGTRMFRWLESQTYPALFYSAWFYIPARYVPVEYWNLFQWKSKHAAGVDPFFVLNIGNRADGTMYFYLWDWQRSKQYEQTVKNVPVGQWFKVEGFYQCAPDSTGHVTLWQDGTKLFDVTGLSTRYADGVCQWSVDNYSNGLSPATATIYIDDLAIRKP